ncbi:DgyrCDS1414 [Dimorphilus gyrociliatus]|uniref:DgyrCDS1414 n=1 Tax=Dimorphilus gyrociliatus TaxID=2664684 RepID=A0A7I8VCB5_9ANNE|nr:DgyrCDS1414 [Dimorphilus gyrociliatus]
MNVNSLNAACDKQRKYLMNVLTVIVVGGIITATVLLLRKSAIEDMTDRKSNQQSTNVDKSKLSKLNMKDRCYLSKNKTCYHPNCIISSSNLLSGRIQKISACQNYYKYSCGGETITRLDAINSKLIRIFDQDFRYFVKRFKSTDEELFTEIRKFYFSCLESVLSEEYIIGIMRIFNRNRLNPYDSEWDEQNWNYSNALGIALKYGLLPINFQEEHGVPVVEIKENLKVNLIRNYALVERFRKKKLLFIKELERDKFIGKRSNQVIERAIVESFRVEKHSFKVNIHPETASLLSFGETLSPIKGASLLISIVLSDAIDKVYDYELMDIAIRKEHCASYVTKLTPHVALTMINSYEIIKEPEPLNFLTDVPKKIASILLKKWKKHSFPERSFGYITDSIGDLLKFWKKPDIKIVYRTFKFPRREFSEMYSYAFKNYANNWLNNLRQWSLLHIGLENFESGRDMLSDIFRYTHALSVNLVKGLFSLHPAHHPEVSVFLKSFNNCLKRKFKELSESDMRNTLIDKIAFEIVYEFMTKYYGASAVKLPGFQGLYTPEKVAFLLNSQSLCRIGGRKRMERVIYTYSTKFKETFSCDRSILINFAECSIFE